MSTTDRIHPGIGTAMGVAPAVGGSAVVEAVARFRERALLAREDAKGRVGVLVGDGLPAGWSEVGVLPGIFPEWLGDRTFNEVHRVRLPYVAGAMANGIATTGLVIAMARAGMLGFFGSAGLSLGRTEAAIDELTRELGTDGASWGSNLIHSPNEPELEASVVDLYLRRGVRRVSASAFMSLTPTVVRYTSSGLRRDAAGGVWRRNHLFAKISRPEVARHFLSPAPAEMLASLVSAGKLTAEEAALAREVPVAEDITVESDSGGHTDNRPLGSLFPIIASLRDDLARTHGYRRPIRVGAAGGIGTPASVASAFSLGAAYVLTGSVNQAAVEAGLSEAGREMLAKADVADVVMAAAADMFELGVEVQVLRRGTMFGVRAHRLYEIYTSHDSIDDIPADERKKLETEIFRRPLADVWKETAEFWQGRNPAERERAERDPKHRMALCFRWYLGLASRWAIIGEPTRTMDYQIWCGPAMGAFNGWVRGSFLEPPASRNVVQIGRNLMEGAAMVTRAQQFRTHGVAVPAAAFQFRPRPLS